MELRVENLVIGRGELPLLADVNFSLHSGQALILRAPNGAGKTTLLRSLAGLQPPMSGKVTLPEDHMVFATHADGIKAQLTVRENLQFWADLFAADASVDAALGAFNLRALETRLAGTLSAGQKRRLGLARLLVTGRKIWLLDEPTVSLDAASVREFGAIVQQHLQAGGLALMATHIDLGIDAQVLDLTPHMQAAAQLRQDQEGFF